MTYCNINNKNTYCVCIFFFDWMIKIFSLRNMRFLQDKKNDAKKLDFFVIVVIQAFFVDENYVV